MSDKYISEKIKKLQEYAPIETIFRIRMDANENPFFPSEAVLTAWKENLPTVAYNRYPDPYAKKLIAAFSSLYGLNPQTVVAGNGSDELISIICTSFLSKEDNVLVVMPDFSMYAFYSGIIEANVIAYPKQEGYAIDFEKLKRIVEEKKVKLVIFSNPCNPTGIAYEKQIVLDFIAAVDTTVIVDEAYMEFCTKDCSVLPYCDHYQNLIVLKTLSKAFGAAGLRIGFAVGGMEYSKGIKKVKSPYNVNSVSQMMATILLEHYSEIQENIQQIKENVTELYNELQKLAEKGKYTLRNTDTNFVLLRFSNPETPKRIFEQLQKHGICVRFMMENCLRITTGTKEENAEFLTVFEALLEEVA